MEKDLTTGKPHSLILSFSLPLLLGNLFQQLYSLVDAIIVGRCLGDLELTGIGNTASITFLVLGFVIGLTNGFCIPVAQSFGAKDYKAMRQYIANASYMCLISSAVITAVSLVFLRKLLLVMQTPEATIELSYEYLVVLFAGITVTMFANLVSSILRAIGDSKTPLKFLILSSILNIALDFFVILVLKQGVAAVGFVTLIAQGVPAVLCLFYIKKRVQVLNFEKGEWKLDFSKWGSLASRGYPMGFQFSVTAIGTLIVQKAINEVGLAAATAMSIAFRVQFLAIMPMETLGITMTSYNGQNVGAGKWNRIKKGNTQALIFGGIYSVFAAVSLYFLNEPFSRLFLGDKATPEILGYLHEFFMLSIPFYPFLAALFVLRAIAQGLGYGLSTLCAGALELASRVIVVVFFAATYGFTAICYANPTAWISASLVMAVVCLVISKRVRKQCRETQVTLRRRNAAEQMIVEVCHMPNG
jgi:putative MATE family efflux protein